jgi:hydroxyacyl-ACP dehydratase HTD2-like protein with hotdog domain
MIDRSRVGFATEPTTERIDAWRVELFCQATGETDPVYWDEAAAHAASHAACPVPATFLKALENEHFSAAELLQLLGAPLRGVLHAGQSFEFHAPFYIGDEIEIDRRIADIHDKKNGTMTFVVVDTEFRSKARVVATSRQTIVLRHEVAAA